MSLCMFRGYSEQNKHRKKLKGIGDKTDEAAVLTTQCNSKPVFSKSEYSLVKKDRKCAT